MTGRKIGLALSGGAVRGAAQIGAIAVLEEHGIPIHIVSGTSAGAAVGALYAAGSSSAEMLDFMRELSWPRTTRFVGTRHLGFFSTNPFRDRLRDALGAVLFDELDKTLIIVACDVLTGSRVLLSQGDIVEAVGASTAIPGLFVPVEHGDALLIDGGAIDNYPVTVPMEFGADTVIGIDIGSRPGEHRPRNAAEVLLSYMDVKTKSSGVRVADVDIIPDVREFSSFDFGSIPEMYERGRTAATEKLPEIFELLDEDA
jgi:NTE family protein